MSEQIKTPAEPLRILFVEDNHDHAELVMRSLEDHRVANSITHVDNGETALDYLMRRKEYQDPATSPRPHVVLLDLRLPRVDGLDVLKQIKADEKLRRIPVVVLTTSDKESDIARAYDLNANAYLVKPIDFSKFVELLRDLGFFWLAWNRPPEVPNGESE
jgi:CheY-like chemotaxis protein